MSSKKSRLHEKLTEKLRGIKDDEKRKQIEKKINELDSEKVDIDEGEARVQRPGDSGTNQFDLSAAMDESEARSLIDGLPSALSRIDQSERFEALKKLIRQAAKIKSPRVRALVIEAALAILEEIESDSSDDDTCDDDTEPDDDASRPTAPVPRSGQTKCFNANYEVVDCEKCRDRPGQDGAIQAGTEWPEQRFKDNKQHGTITDLLTGLTWLRNPDAYGEVTWDQARVLAENLHDGCHGLCDGSKKGEWRLPTIRELFSIVDYGQADPIVPASLPNRECVVQAIYWSSTTLLADPTQAWMMTFGIGPTVFMLKSTKNCFWPVKGVSTSVPKTGQSQTFGFDTTGQDGAIGNRWGVEWPERRFLLGENGLGTVTDALTGLVWLQNANPFGWVTWEEALKKCLDVCDGIKGLKDGSKKGDWRLPNVKEMESLVDYGRVGPCLPDGWHEAFLSDPNSPVGSTLQPSSYWSSTTVVGAPSQALFIILGVGPVIFENKLHQFFALPVRNRI